MAFKIERALTALFKVLKLRSQGRLPYDMVEFVQPTFDLNPWALQAISPSVAEICPITAGTAPDQSVSYVQPTDWLVVLPQAFGISSASGEYLLPQVLWQPDGNAGEVVVADCRRWGIGGNHQSVAASELFVTLPQVTVPYWFSPAGAIWKTRVNVITIVTAPNFRGRVIHYDLARQ